MGRSSRKDKSSGFFANLFRGLFRGDGALRADSAARKRKGDSHRRLRFEGVEDRRMLSVGVNYNPVTDTLALTGSAAGDTVTVVGRATYVDIFVSGNFQARLQNANSTNVSTINFNGAGGNDSLAVQNIVPAAGLTVGLTDVETFSILKGPNTAVNSNGALNLAASSVTGNLAVNITGAGDLTQSGGVTVPGLTSLALANGDILLTNAANNFATLDIDANAVAGQDASITDVNGVVFAASEVTGNLTVQANRNSTRRTAISQTGALDVDGTTTLTVGSGSTIKLDNALNALTGAVTIADGSTATLYNTLATELGESRLRRDLSVTAEGAITQSGPLTVSNVATFKARTTGNLDQDITLDNADNNFRILGVTNGANVAIVDVNAIVLNKSAVSGTLDVTTDGAITQRAELVVNGAAAFEAGPDNSITLSRSTNNFSSVGIGSGQNVYLRDSNALDLAGSTIEGTLYVIAGGAITDSGALSVKNGKTTLKAPSNQAITLNEAGNDFLEVAVASAQNVTLVDSNDLILATSRISGTLAVTTTGELTQSGGLAVKSNTATFSAGGDVVLDDARNDFKAVVVTGGANVWLRDLNAVILGTSAVAGDLTLQANLNASRRLAVSQANGTTLTVGGSTIVEGGSGSTITLDKANTLHGVAGEVSVTSGASATLTNAGNLILGVSSVSGDLTATSNTGTITQTGGLVVGKTGRFTTSAPNQNITLDDGDNNFGTFIASASGAVVVTVNDVNSLILGPMTLGGTVSLSVTTDGAITQSGILSIAGATTLSAGELYDIVLSNPSNEFASVGIDSAQNVVLRDTTDIELAASTISGTLSVTAAGIDSTAVLDVAGRATFVAKDGSGLYGVSLTGANILGEVAVPYADTVTLVNSDALILAASNIAGTLDVTTTNGGLTQSGALTVGDTTTLTIDGDIELKLAANNFAALGVVGAENVWLRDINAIVLDGATLSGDLEVTAGGNITQTAGGGLTAFGNTTLATSVIADITLTELNSFGLLPDNFVAVTSAKNVSLTSDSDLQLGASTITGSLTVTLNNAGPITLSQLGALAVGDTLTLNVGNTNDVDLTDVGNTFDTVSVASGLNVSLRSAGSLDLAASTVSGNLTVVSEGAITDSGTVSVAGDTDLTAVGDITLDSAASTYGTGGAASALQLSGADVAVTNARDTVLADLFATGDLTLNVTGNLTNRVAALVDELPFNGNLSVAGAASMTATGDITLYTAGWSYGSLFTNGASVANYPATAPVLAGIEAAALAYTTGNDTQITASVTVNDTDTPTIGSATIRITGNFNATHDQLKFTGTAAITGAWNAVTGTLTLTGADTVANYQAALRSVLFFTDDVGANDRTVTFTVNDGSLDSNSVTRDITVS